MYSQMHTEEEFTHLINIGVSLQQFFILSFCHDRKIEKYRKPHYVENNLNSFNEV